MPKQSMSEFAIPDPAALQSPDEQSAAPQSGEHGQVANVLEKNTDRLMRLEGVVMVGEGQDQLGQPAIVVGVKEPHQLKGLPKSVEGVAIVGWVIGEVDALGAR
jgi:hypothetical protein